jgi:hypothetical protein
METKPEKETVSKTRKIRPGKSISSLKRRLFRKCQRVCGNKAKKGKRAFKSMLSIPHPSSLIIVSMGAFCLMCYLLGLDPSLIPFTLLFMILVTLFLLDDNQRNFLMKSIVPGFVMNFCLYIYNIFSSKKTVDKPNKSRNNIDNNDNNNLEDMNLNQTSLDNAEEINKM